MSKVSPFANKVYELARNVRLATEKFEDTGKILLQLFKRCDDLPYLLSELECDEEELLEMTMRYHSLKAEIDALATLTSECHQRAIRVAEEILSDKFFGPYMARRVVNPHSGIFSPDILVMAKTVCAKYMARSRRSG